ncbi:MAG: hypothetical protein ACK4GD_09335 [Sphingomonadaceae bacterium]
MSLLRFLSFVLAFTLVPQTAAAKTWREVNPLVNARPATVAAQGVTVQVVPMNEIVFEDGEEFEIGSLRVTVTFPGGEPIAVLLDEAVVPTHGLWVGIGKLGRRDAHPVVILTGYTGGMHCCVTAQLVTRQNGQPRVLGLPMMDGDPNTGFPRDIDGDGMADILRADDSFLYAFTSYAGSWAPPQLWNLRGGEMVDVSAEPRFAAFWQREAKKVGKPCRRGQVGACAAYAAAMARLGRAEQGIAEALRNAPKADWLPEPCTVDLVEDECPEGKALVFGGFEEALRWLLRENGYLRDPAALAGAD